MQGDEQPIEIDFPSLTKRQKEVEPVATESDDDDYGWLGALFADDDDEPASDGPPDADTHEPPLSLDAIAPDDLEPPVPAARHELETTPDPHAHELPPSLDAIAPDDLEPPALDEPAPATEFEPATPPALPAGEPSPADASVDEAAATAPRWEPVATAPDRSEALPPASRDEVGGESGVQDPHADEEDVSEETLASTAPTTSEIYRGRRGLREELLATFSQLHRD